MKDLDIGGTEQVHTFACLLFLLRKRIPEKTRKEEESKKQVCCNLVIVWFSVQGRGANKKLAFREALRKQVSISTLAGKVHNVSGATMRFVRA